MKGMKMSRISKYAAVLGLTTLMTPVMAAEISDKGAMDIQKTLTKYLPKDIAEQGFLKVTPDSGRYRVDVDFEPLIAKMGANRFSITGLRPVIQYLTPQDDGLWRIQANQDLDIQIETGNGAPKVSFAYKIDRIDFDGLFDPSISYFTDFKSTATNVVTKTQGDGLTNAVSIGSMEQTLKTTKVDDKHVTMFGTGTLKDIKQAITAQVPGGIQEAGSVFNFNIDSASVEARLEKFNIVAFRDLVIFVLDHIDEDKLTTENGETLKTILRANLPFGDKIEEKLTLTHLKIPTKGSEVAIGEIIYQFGLNGITQNLTVGVDLSARDMAVPAGILPKGTEVALPQSVSLGIAVTRLNLEGAATYFLDHADFAAEEPLTPTETAAIGKIILPDGKLHLEFRNVSAKSPQYDIEMSGKMAVDVNNANDSTVDVTIYSRDLDRTIAFMQEFGLVSFAASAMKGFAKKEADGRYYWHVTKGEDGKIKVNGQDLPQ